MRGSLQFPLSLRDSLSRERDTVAASQKIKQSAASNSTSALYGIFKHCQQKISNSVPFKASKPFSRCSRNLI